MRLLLALALSLAPVAAQASTLLVANKSEATVSLLDLASGKISATLPTGKAPHEIAVSPSGKRALISNYGTREEPGSTLTVIDVPGAKVEKTIDLGDYKRPHGMVFVAEGRALVTAEANQALLVVDVDAGKVLQSIATGQEVSHMVAVTPDGKRAFVANIGSGTVTAIDLEAGKSLGDIKTGDGAEGIDVTPDGKQVWVTNRAADTVSVLDASTLAVSASVPSASFPIRAKVTPDGRHVLVTNAKSGDLAVFSAADRSLERKVPLALTTEIRTEGRLMAFGDSSVPIGVLVEPSGKRAFVAHANADEISIVDLSEWKKVGSLTADKEPDGMGYSAVSVGR